MTGVPATAVEPRIVVIIGDVGMTIASPHVFIIPAERYDKPILLPCGEALQPTAAPHPWEDFPRGGV